MDPDSVGGDVLARELAAQERGRIVVAVDGSPASQAALRWAAAIAERTDWLLDAVMTWELPVNYGWNSVVLDDFDWQADTEKALTAIVDEVFGAARPRDLRTYVLKGDAAHSLIEHAADARMLVVGNRGRGGFLGLRMGSVSSKCVSHAACPVLVVHAEDQAPRLAPPVSAQSRA